MGYDEALTLKNNKDNAFYYIFVYMQYLFRNHEDDPDIVNFVHNTRKAIVDLGYDFGPIIEFESEENVLSMNEHRKKLAARRQDI